MRYFGWIGLTLGIGIGITAPAWAQGMAQAPQIPGEFKPVVGAGARYEVTTKKGQKVAWAYAVVGKEDVGGAEGYWLEMRLEGQGEESVVMKHLLVIRAGKAEVKRMIVQPASQPPLEMPLGMMGGMMREGQQAAGGAGLGEKVGTETITVPAGTFLCDHFRTQYENTGAEVWVSTQVSPYGLVKMTSADVTMVLTKILQDETSHIKGQPRKMDFRLPGMPQ